FEAVVFVTPVDDALRCHFAHTGQLLQCGEVSGIEIHRVLPGARGFTRARWLGGCCGRGDADIDLFTVDDTAGEIDATPVRRIFCTTRSVECVRDPRVRGQGQHPRVGHMSDYADHNGVGPGARSEEHT